MAFVPGHDYDIFLSYASVDDQPRDPTDAESCWVRCLFLPALKTAIETELGRTGVLRVFFDRRELDSASQLGSTIARAIEGTAIMVAINSPGYLHPEATWCRLERQRFLRVLGDSDATRAAQRRLWIIHKDAMVRETWQKEFYPDVRGMEFFIRDRDDQVRLLPRQDQKQEFLDRIETVARGIAGRLQEMKRAAEEGRFEEPRPIRTQPGPSDAPKPPCVYLAETTGELETSRSWMKDHLEAAGVRVLPQGEDAGGDYAAWVRGQISESIAFVQLLSQYPWKRGHFDVIQHREAGEAGIPMFRHRPREIDLESVPEPHRAFIGAGDVMSIGLGDFKDHVLRCIEGLKVKSRQEPPPSTPTGFVRILVRDADRSALGPVAARWVDAAGVRVDVLKEEESLVEANRYDPCQGIMVLYGTDTPDGLRDRMLPCRTIIFDHHHDPERAPEVAVVYCPPPDPVTEKPLLLTLPKLRRLRFDGAEGVQEFLRRVREIAS